MEKLAPHTERTTKGKIQYFNSIIDGLKISNSQVKRLERELKNLKEEVSISIMRIYMHPLNR